MCICVSGDMVKNIRRRNICICQKVETFHLPRSRERMWNSHSIKYEVMKWSHFSDLINIKWKNNERHKNDFRRTILLFGNAL